MVKNKQREFTIQAFFLSISAIILALARCLSWRYKYKYFLFISVCTALFVFSAPQPWRIRVDLVTPDPGAAPGAPALRSHQCLARHQQHHNTRVRWVIMVRQLIIAAGELRACGTVGDVFSSSWRHFLLFSSSCGYPGSGFRQPASGPVCLYQKKNCM